MDVNRIYDLLVHIEWGCVNEFGILCPVCQADKDEGHEPGCELKNIMQELEDDTTT